MLSQTLPVERVSSGTQPKRSTTADRTWGERALRVESARETNMQPGIDRLLVMLSPNESHHDVAIRAQLLASEASVRRAVVLTRRMSESQRVFQQIPVPGLNRATRPDIDTSLRLLHAASSAGQIRVETRERPADVLTLANESDLVLVGRRRTFPGLWAPLGADARRLLRRARTPLLVVGGKPKGPYRRVVVATDLETDITPALAWARRVAPQAAVTLLHVYRGLFEGKLQWAGVPDEQIISHRVAAQHKAALGMAALLEQHDRKTINRALLAHGLAVSDVVRKAGELDADLIVVVRSNHSWWIEALAASVSVEVATRADRDVLVVHAASIAPFMSAGE
jgi:nucleotide-binding universal stress UspA family protein